MFQHRQSSPAERTIAEQAAAWALEPDSELPEDRRADRDLWLSEKREHAEAYRAACAVLGSLQRNAATPEMLALRESALAARAQPIRSRRWLFATAAAVVFMAIGSVAWWTLQHRDTSLIARYATAVGERSTIALKDGSVMTLNTDSIAEVAYSDRERSVRLLQGQALFSVAHGRPEPFRVYASNHVVTAVGTTFDVRLRGERVEVAMLEGVVRVEGGTAATETVTAGETLATAPDEPTRVRTADVDRVVSWRSGLLTFAGTPLAEAVAEVNRYTLDPLTLAEPELGTFKVSGTFRVGEPERFARTMTEVFPLEVEQTETGGVRLVARHK